MLNCWPIAVDRERFRRGVDWRSGGAEERLRRVNELIIISIMAYYVRTQHVYQNN